MNKSPGAARAMLRIVLLLTAAVYVLALILAFSISPAEASSGSGGTPSGGGATAQESKYTGLWAQVSRADRQWARAVAMCESGANPQAVGGGGQYRGAFQFTLDTWRRAPKSPGGDPIEFGYKTQAVVAVALRRRDGAGHWPNCG